MFGSLQLLNQAMDLDAPWVNEVQFELAMPNESESVVEDEGAPSWDRCLVWFTALLRFTLESRGTVVRLRRDREGECLCQFVFVPPDRNDKDGEWLECVPMPWSPRDSGMRAVRMIAFMMPWSKRGTIRYRYKGKWAKARCVQESPDDLAIYFASDRPILRRLTQEHSSAD